MIQKQKILRCIVKYCDIAIKARLDRKLKVIDESIKEYYLFSNLIDDIIGESNLNPNIL